MNGRPPHQPTDESREKVAILAGGGMSHEDIALVVGVSRPTLEKWYEHELSIGAQEKRAAVMQAVFESATRKGNVAAAKLFMSHEPRLAAPPLQEEEPVVEGKKAKAAADAKTAASGTEWDELLTGNNVVAMPRR